MRELYDRLEEGADGDGFDDFLIEDSYRKPGSSYAISEDLYGVYVTDTSSEEYDTVCDKISIVRTAFIYDHPELFWLSPTVHIVRRDTGGQVSIYYLFHSDTYDVRLPDWPDEASVREAQSLLEERLSEILPEGMSEPDAMRRIHDFLIRENGYNTTADADGTFTYGFPCTSLCALLGNAGDSGPVCLGYAKAFKLCCDRLDIPCLVGWNTEHAWNYAYVDGRWYGVDVTWDDSPSMLALSGLESEAWFLSGRYTYQNGKTFGDSHVMSFSDTACPDVPVLAYDTWYE